MVLYIPGGCLGFQSHQQYDIPSSSLFAPGYLPPDHPMALQWYPQAL